MLNTTTIPGNNITAPTNKTEYNFTTSLIGCQVANLFLLLTSIWILISLILYGTRNKKWRKKPGTSTLNSGLIYKACVMSVALLIPRYLFNAVIFQLPSMEKGLLYCERITDISIAVRLISRCAIYVFLWLRQRILYEHPSTRRFAGKYVNFISWTSLLVIISTFGGLFWASIFPSNYEASPYGCVRNPDSSSNGTAGYILGTGLILAQLLLLGLFIYPMVRGRVALQNTCKNANGIKQQKHIRNVFCCFQDHETKSSDSVVIMIRRSVLCTIIAALSDFGSAVIKVFISSDTVPHSIMTTIYSTSTLINIFCAISTFEMYVSILKTPCTMFCEAEENEEGKKDGKCPNESDSVSPSLGTTSMTL
uniref:uncharacterized protein LOC120329057 n=1 Tax=Styela clava TaxID=7725 RepID=UPI00193A322F|nr:uncharacterized protein LOC120329057 [Styela clava]